MRDIGTEDCEEPVPGTYFYYDSKVDVCQPFYYLGCGGTTNRFKSAEKCRLACKGATDNRKSIATSKCFCFSCFRFALRGDDSFLKSYDCMLHLYRWT